MLRFSQMKAITLKKLVADFVAVRSCCCTSSDLCGVTSESAFFTCTNGAGYYTFETRPAAHFSQLSSSW